MGEKDRATMPSENRIRQSAWVTVICDAVLLFALVACLLFYIYGNNENIYRQNVENISGIAAANSRLVQTALEKTSLEVKRAFNYCNGKSVPEILEYLSVINADDEEYQLLKLDEDTSTDTFHVYSGYSTKTENGEFRRIEYRDTSLSTFIYNHHFQKDGEVSFLQSFTNKTDALRYFAIFCSITVTENDESTRYYLIKPQKESVVLSQTQKYLQYSDMSVAVCYTNGKYLAHDDDFRGDNFFDYLYKYNSLSLDEKNRIKSEMQTDDDGQGVLTYLDYAKRECVYAYSTCDDDSNWVVVICVPTTGFSSEKLLSPFPTIIITFLTVLLLFNIYRLLVIVKELRKSVVREQIANAAKSSFLSRMSHEIRTPLNAIIGYNTIAKDEIKTAEYISEHRQSGMKIADCLTKSEIASKHLLTVINDVLDMSAIESGKIKLANEVFDFRGVIASLTPIFYSQAKAKGVDFEVIFSSLTEEWFVGDQTRVTQILTNLISNAVKFTSEGGSVTLRITQPNAEANASHIRFEISDTGIGITPEYLAHIWAPFEQEDSSISRRFGGSGLGLSITKSLVDIMGGKIEVDSIQGVGTTFRVDLTFGRTEQPRNTSVYDFSSVNALVVDDDQSTCDYIRLLFNRCGAKCTAVTSGADALKTILRAKERGENYSLCLVDWRMPNMDGIETIRQIKKISGDTIPTIVLTAYDYTELADKVAEVGINKFISKPLFQSSLFDLLAGICGTSLQSPMSKDENFDFEGARVLLAEDNNMNMEIAKTIMQSAGLVVDSAWNGREAVDMFESSPAGTYKAILMDVHMPEMDGHEATRTIRASFHEDAKTIPIIAMTADAFSENVAEAYASGMNEHISKPIDIPVLFNILKQYI